MPGQRDFTHERAKGQETGVHLSQELPLLCRIVLGIPLPKVHPRLPWRPLRCLSGRNNAGIEFTRSVGNAIRLVIRLRTRHRVVPLVAVVEA